MKTSSPLSSSCKSFALHAAIAVVALSLLPALTLGDSPSLDELLDLKPTQLGDPATGDGDATPDDPSKAGNANKIVPPPQAGGSPEQIFDRALEHMRQASDRMGEQLDVGLQTQRLQTSALSLIDQVIAEAAKQQQQQQQQQDQQQQQKQQSGSSENQTQSQKPGPSGQSNQPGQPGESAKANKPGGQNAATQDGTTQGSPANANPGDPLEESKTQWGNLPPRLRDQLLQGMNERFSPIYQQLTEAYYRRLAEESSQ